MFKKLHAPLKAGMHGWIIPIIGNSVGWLTVNGIMETLAPPYKDYYFDSELDAHNAALNYYYKYTRAYPYYIELHKLRKEQMDNDDTVDISESQIMEFI